MNQITIVTYLRAEETVTENFYRFINYFLQAELLKRVIVFSDIIRNDIPSEWTFYMDNGRTKYARLSQLILAGADLFLLSVDNDMELDFAMSKTFCTLFIESNASIGWGRVGVSNHGFVADMVAVDKILSHNYIRPLLWKLHWGISVPGQFFILRCLDYRDKLIPQDTFLDDLQIGLISNRANLTVFHPAMIVGCEMAKGTLEALFLQRKRWAKGYSCILRTSLGLSMYHFALVLIHGFSYHVLFPLLIISICILSLSNLYIALFSYSVLCVILSDRKFRLLGGVGCYCICFPVLHLYWGYYMFTNLRSKII